MRTHLRTVCLAFLATFVLAGIAAAQQPPPPPKAREAKAEFAGQVIFRPPQWVIDGQTAFVRNEAQNVVSAKSFAARGRAARVLTPRLQAFGQQSYLRDLFSGVVHRNLTDGGITYAVVQTARNTCAQMPDLAI